MKCEGEGESINMTRAWVFGQTKIYEKEATFKTFSYKKLRKNVS